MILSFQVGGSRRDAALDAMRAFGFEDSLTRKTLNELLKVFELALYSLFFFK